MDTKRTALKGFMALVLGALPLITPEQALACDPGSTCYSDMSPAEQSERNREIATRYGGDNENGRQQSETLFGGGGDGGSDQARIDDPWSIVDFALDLADMDAELDQLAPMTQDELIERINEDFEVLDVLLM